MLFMITRPTIVYFSGTGNVAFVVRQLEDAFLESGASPFLLALETKDKNKKESKGEYLDPYGLLRAQAPVAFFSPYDTSATDKMCPIPKDSDFLMLVFPVHSFDAPAPLLEFVESLNAKQQRDTAVISVSGGGDILPNRACRARLIKRLEKKLFHVVYEAEVTMTSNFMYPTPPHAAAAIIRVLPETCRMVVDELQSGLTLRTKAPVIDRICSQLGLLERSRGMGGQTYFGKHIRAGSSCVGCSWCADHCPRGNISMQERALVFDDSFTADDASVLESTFKGMNTPVFGDSCVICLRCLYGCPKHALRAESNSFSLIKEGYSLKAVIDNALSSASEAASEDLLRKELKGFLWKGVREYLGLE